MPFCGLLITDLKNCDVGLVPGTELRLDLYRNPKEVVIDSFDGPNNPKVQTLPNYILTLTEISLHIRKGKHLFLCYTFFSRIFFISRFFSISRFFPISRFGFFFVDGSNIISIFWAKNFKNWILKKKKYYLGQNNSFSRFFA